VNLVLPEWFSFHAEMEVMGGRNHLEIKLVDDTGSNVWRAVWPMEEDGRMRLELPGDAFAFAWGPAGGGIPHRVSAVEFAVVAVVGGTGGLLLREARFLDSTGEPPLWKSDPETGSLEARFNTLRRLGGIIIAWEASAPANGFEVELSAGAERRFVYRTERGAGGPEAFVVTPHAAVDAFRLSRLGNGVLPPCRVEWLPPSAMQTPEAPWERVATGARRGWYPRWLLREQTLWTCAGTSEGLGCALLSEDGVVELAPGAPGIEPVLWLAGRLVTWADVRVETLFAGRWAPEPMVRWHGPEGWLLEIALRGCAGGVFEARYRFEARQGHFDDARLLLMVRPFQVVPPWQRYRNMGGLSAIHSAVVTPGRLTINDRALIHFSDEVPAGRCGAMASEMGYLVALLADGDFPERSSAEDERGYGAAVAEFALGVCAEVRWQSAEGRVEPWDWEAAMPFPVEGPEELVAGVRTALAHAVMTREGPALQPGPRRYTRSWIRDGTIMSAALLRGGWPGAGSLVRGFITWYARFVRSDGFVPCCVDSEGPDLLVEHDSHGQFLALVTDYCRFTADWAFADALWPTLASVCEQAIRLIEPESGLLPVSASHEGYLAQPVHAFWDDYWALRGLHDFTEIATRCGAAADANKAASAAAALEKAIQAAISETCTLHGLSYVPASVEWADFDPTALAGALRLFDELPGAGSELVAATFERYMEDWRRKRNGAMAWTQYTPYEVRIVGALIRLGKRDAAHELLAFLLRDRRPESWRQWPEIAWRDRNAPGHLGDLPHTWIAAEFAVAIREMFVFESERRNAMVVGAGILMEWLDEAGIYLNGLPTAWGPLTARISREPSGTVTVEIAATLSLPPGGKLLVELPCGARSLDRLPATVTFP
jgi:hypothetical protein